MDIAEAEKDEGAGMKVYIERTAVMNVLEQYYPGVNERLYIVKDITSLPAADVAPVVRCKDCEYSYDEISYLCCSHGVCVDCEVPPNFYCAEGKRKENDE